MKPNCSFIFSLSIWWEINEGKEMLMLIFCKIYCQVCRYRLGEHYTNRTISLYQQCLVRFRKFCMSYRLPFFKDHPVVLSQYNLLEPSFSLWWYLFLSANITPVYQKLLLIVKNCIFKSTFWIGISDIYKILQLF